MTTRAPSLPSTPLSFGLGLLFRPFLLFRNPNMPPEPSFLESTTVLASVGRVASWRASSDQLPPPSSVTETPPVGLATRLLVGGKGRETYWLWYCGGSGAGRDGRPCVLSKLGPRSRPGGGKTRWTSVLAGTGIASSVVMAWGPLFGVTFGGDSSLFRPWVASVSLVKGQHSRAPFGSGGDALLVCGYRVVKRPKVPFNHSIELILSNLLVRGVLL